ncbi:MAG: 4-hydroxythreonine-4-phosphate dehydrogenase PdxA [Rikenellaceae bacterium]
MAEQKLKIGITQGDTNGIGWELILKIFSDSRITELCTPIIYGSAKCAEFYKKGLSELDTIKFNVVQSARDAQKGRVNLVEVGDPNLEIKVGVATPAAGLAAVDALTKAAEELKSGILDGIVTAPFNKESVQCEGFQHTGHTEFMNSMFEGNDMMMMCSELLRVGLVTKHIPLAQVSGAISKEMIVDDLLRLRQTLIKDFSIVEPRIGVMALNPHSGDGGLLGDDEQTIIIPAIKEAYAQGVMAFGPYAADGLFSNGGYKKFDAVLAMYHDQGLIPFKALSPDGVNFTAGLTAVRTSPDHGVAYDIAGKGVADPGSMRMALYMAIDIVESRRRYAKMSMNPLQHAEREKSHRDMSVKDLNLPKTEH